jgi:nucleotide-binding universal stress UspA family protein
MDTVANAPPVLGSEAPCSQPRASSGPRPRQGIRRILVCLDHSRLSEVSLPHAVFVSKTFGSAMTLLHVMQPPHERPGPSTTDALGWEISRQEANAYLERFERELTEASGQRVDTRLEQGHPAERIMALAREIHADLIVLGSHGEGGVTSWNLGSTVQQILSVARVSVLVAHSTAAVPSVVTPKRILVPLDGALRTESVLPIVARIAAAHGTEVLLVHVVAEPQPTAVLHATEDLELARELATRLESRANRYLDHLRDQLARELQSVRTLVIRHADERQSLLELAQKEQTDLIVLSAHGSTCNAARPFGSVTAHLLTHSAVPLLVLQDLPDSEHHHAREGDEELAPALRGSYPPEGN